MYYSYHAVAKRLIREGHLTECKWFPQWGDIAPALVLFFDTHRPMPIREERIAEYEELIRDALNRIADK